MQTLRAVLNWIFAFAALFWLFFTVVFPIIISHSADLWDARAIVGGLFFETILLAIAATYGMSWWTAWRRKASERPWGIAASVITTLASAGLFFLSLLPRAAQVPHRRHGLDPETLNNAAALIGLAVGLVGLIVFLQRYKRLDLPAKTQGRAAIRGDGTSSLVNRAMVALVVVAAWEASSWWESVCNARSIPLMHGGLLRDAPMLAVVILVAILLHELGHTTAGLAMGMRLRCFIVGPFQWRIRDGRWKFEFSLKKMLSGGAAGLVPTRPDFPNRRYVWMIAAGPMASAGTGLVALGIAFAAGPHSPLQAGGALSFFAVISLLAAGLNLAPFKTAGSYSDGARIYQFLSGGPWGDYHRAISSVSASLVTPTRPRDYDIQAIESASQGIDRGHEGLLLRIFEGDYHLDRGEQTEAVQAFQRACAIYVQSATDISVELYSVFVFDWAFLLRDAAAARQWWERMEAKKPTRFNVDYWRAKSALAWIEGDRKNANDAWEKSNLAAQKLPHAGAYEFDRYLCALLRRAIDESAAQGGECGESEVR